MLDALYSIINHPNFYMGISSILTALIALAAILTWKSARKTLEETKLSKKAFLAPNENAGFIHLGVSNDDDLAFQISLKNYGINPISNLIMKVYFIVPRLNDNDFIYTIDSPLELFHCINPLPCGTQFILPLKKKNLSETQYQKSNITYRIELLSIEGLVVEASYKDSILNFNEHSVFYWYNLEGKWIEPNEEKYTLYKSLFDDYSGEKIL